MSILEVVFVLDILGTFVFAISGALKAREHRLDLFGAVFVAITAALGGGTVRDMLLGYSPVFWMEETIFVQVSIVAAILVFFSAGRFKAPGKLFILVDAIGIAVCTTNGLQKAFLAGVTAQSAIIAGVINAIMGGILRDIICNETPLVLRKEIYATACIAGGLVYVLLDTSGLAHFWVIAVVILTVVSIRMAAVTFGLSLPRPGR